MERSAQIRHPIFNYSFLGRVYNQMDSSKTFFFVILLELSFSSLDGDEPFSDHFKSNSCENQYSETCQSGKNGITTEEMFRHGHMKPFGSHRPPDFIVEELPYMISPQDFYMNYVAKHKPVVFKGKYVLVSFF